MDDKPSVPVLSEPRTWRVVQNIVLAVPVKVWGTVLHTTVGVQENINGELVDPDMDSETQVGRTWVMSGAKIEGQLPLLQEKTWLRMKVIMPMEANVHTNLEDVFGPDTSRKLRENDIWTLEDVAAEKPASLAAYWMVGKVQTVPLRQFLSAILQQDVVAELLEETKRYLGAQQGKPPEFTIPPKPLVEVTPPPPNRPPERKPKEKDSTEV